MVYGEFSPHVIFGVSEEEGTNRLLSQDFLDTYGMSTYPDEIVRLHACTFIYGLIVPFDELSDKKKRQSEENKVKKFVNALRDQYGIDLGEPELKMCICGDFELCHQQYTPKLVTGDKNCSTEVEDDE